MAAKCRERRARPAGRPLARRTQSPPPRSAQPRRESGHPAAAGCSRAGTRWPGICGPWCTARAAAAQMAPGRAPAMLSGMSQPLCRAPPRRRSAAPRNGARQDNAGHTELRSGHVLRRRCRAQTRLQSGLTPRYMSAAGRRLQLTGRCLVNALQAPVCTRQMTGQLSAGSLLPGVRGHGGEHGRGSCGAAAMTSRNASGRARPTRRCQEVADESTIDGRSRYVPSLGRHTGQMTITTRTWRSPASCTSGGTR